MKQKEALIFFSFYSIFGWCIDTLSRSFRLQEWTADNMLGIPFSPMYGFAALGVLYIHQYIKHWALWQQFLLYAVTSAGYEYAGGVLSEWFLDRRLWDYSIFPFNIHAYTDPFHATAWGLLALFVVYWLHPHLKQILRGTHPFQFAPQRQNRR